MNNLCSHPKMQSLEDDCYDKSSQELEDSVRCCKRKRKSLIKLSLIANSNKPCFRDKTPEEEKPEIVCLSDQSWRNSGFKAFYKPLI